MYSPDGFSLWGHQWDSHTNDKLASANRITRAENVDDALRMAGSLEHMDLLWEAAQEHLQLYNEYVTGHTFPTCMWASMLENNTKANMSVGLMFAAGNMDETVESREWFMEASAALLAGLKEHPSGTNIPLTWMIARHVPGVGVILTQWSLVNMMSRSLVYEVEFNEHGDIVLGDVGLPKPHATDEERLWYAGSFMIVWEFVINRVLLDKTKHTSSARFTGFLSKLRKAAEERDLIPNESPEAHELQDLLDEVSLDFLADDDD